MFTQLFGSYLLHEKLVTPEQLNQALDYQKKIHVKLGVLAINLGFMTANEVDRVHNLQSIADKKFGEIAIQINLLDEEKLNILLSTQKSGHVLLGQAMIDKGYMTLEKYEEALNNYKRDYCLTDDQFKLIQNGDIDEIVNTFYKLDGVKNEKICKEYIAIFIRNIIRFIGNDFKISNISKKEYDESTNCKWFATQNIFGDVKLFTSISAQEKPLLAFTERYAEETLEEVDEYAKSSFGEFLNLVNGLFIVNMSNDGVEMELTPQIITNEINEEYISQAFSISFDFPFGVVDFTFKCS